MSLGALERAGGGDALRTLRSDFELFARSLKIRPEEGGRVVPFHLLAGQRRVRAACGDARRVLILKPRRLGITTLRLGVSLHGIWGRPHHQALMVGHRADDAQTIFESASLMDRELPEALKHHRATTNKREIVYDLMGSRLGIATAAGHGISRGDTLHEVHLTEVARYTGDVADTIAGLDEAARAGRMIGETTAYGARGWFYETWMECRSGGGPWLCVFAKWWWDDRNRIALSARERRRFRLTAEERVWAIPNRVPLEAVAWYREKCKTLKALVKQEYPCTDLEAFVVSGRHFFDQEKIVTMACNLPAPIASELGGAQLTWEDYDEDERYIIGADPAEGTPSGDWSYASVHARGDGRQVARYRAKCVPAEFARALARLGDRYGTALIVVERNRIEAVRRLRREEGYRNVYYRRLKSGKRDREPGYVIDTQTRPLVLDGLKEALEGWAEEPGWLVIRDPVFYSEATTFEDSGSGKYEASSGFHDDSILAIAIMLQARAVPIPTIRFV